MTSDSRLRWRQAIPIFCLCTMALTFSLASPATASSTTKGSFSPAAHKTALVKVLDAMSSPHRLNELTIKASPVNATWVYFTAGIPTAANGNPAGGEDLAEGFAHWVTAKWEIIYGPWSAMCGPLNSLKRLPLSVRHSFTKICKL